jgi:AP2 domain.
MESDYVEIPLRTQGLVTLVSRQDSDRVSRHVWYASGKLGKTGRLRYAHRAINGKSQFLHHFILEIETGSIKRPVDHIDGNGLNNTRENLRITTQSSNCQRTFPKPTNGFQGIQKQHSLVNKWVACIRIGGKNKRYLGSFSTPEEAATEYDLAALKIHGSLAKKPTSCGQKSGEAGRG